MFTDGLLIPITEEIVAYRCRGWGWAELQSQPSCSPPPLYRHYWSCSGAVQHRTVRRSCCLRPCCTAGSYPHSVAKPWSNEGEKLGWGAANQVYIRFFFFYLSVPDRWWTMKMLWHYVTIVRGVFIMGSVRLCSCVNNDSMLCLVLTWQKRRWAESLCRQSSNPDFLGSAPLPVHRSNK